MTEIDTNKTNAKTQEFSYENFKKMVQKNKQLIGIDYGTVRIGIAVSDKEQTIAQPFKIISKIIELNDIVKSKDAGGFVIGMPFETSGNEGKTAALVRAFANRLDELFRLPILFVDERHSSKYAEDNMRSIGMREKKLKKTLDAQVARDLLQRALNELKNIK